MIRNPKQEGSNIFSCRVQTGICPIRCNQCYYNRDNGAAFYCDIDEPHIPDPDTLPDNAIVRFNDGHDSSIELDKVIAQAAKYKNVFYNTSRILRLDKIPAPVVLTVNPNERTSGYIPSSIRADDLKKIMYARIRITPLFLDKGLHDVWHWTNAGIPVVLTFMAYFDGAQIESHKHLYEFKVRHINSYYCLLPEMMDNITQCAKLGSANPELVYTCGTRESNLCKDCLNCETLYLRWKAMQ